MEIKKLRNIMLTMIVIVASVMVINAVTTISDDNIITTGNLTVDSIFGLEDKGLVIRTGNSQGIRVVIGINSSEVSSLMSDLPIIPDNKTTIFLGDVNNIDNIDEQSRFSETNINNGTSASAGFTAINDVGNNVAFGIGSSQFTFASINFSNDGAIFLISPGKFNFANSFYSQWNWRANLDNSSSTFNFTESMQLSPGGNLNIAGNFTGDQIYGGAWQYDMGNVITITGANVWANVTNFTQGEVNGFRMSDDNISLISNVGGAYNAEWSISFTDSANRVFRGAFAINDVIQNSTASSRKTATPTDRAAFGGGNIIKVEANDKIQLMILNEDDGSDMTVFFANFKLARVGS